MQGVVRVLHRLHYNNYYIISNEYRVCRTGSRVGRVRCISGVMDDTGSLPKLEPMFLCPLSPPPSLRHSRYDTHSHTLTHLCLDNLYHRQETEMDREGERDRHGEREKRIKRIFLVFILKFLYRIKLNISLYNMCSTFLCTFC